VNYLQWWPEILIGCLVLLNVGATLEMVLSPFLVPRQRAVWLLFIWLVPLAGAVISLIYAWRNYRGLDCSPDLEALEDIGVPSATRTRGKVPGDWDELDDD